ncbi:putative lipoprotein [Melioribacter roseus P3M-2]|jgi:hypothetical protein|uniref:Putative lipoprotein n=1 Tax=Melioribacter roseus (strain DSM 23840 / JCM 17771 / VKM B-2668 / P3M-2) TaxID=1191523 RepID=I6Z9D5_MELRP|nr:PEGA domain-containing protein [Melioribacter roseus]AFN75750.1 putative lipoprotein [Melioribacter roseus P3M-2]
MKAHYKLIASTLILSFLLSGCALLFQGINQKVSLDSSPDTAEVWVNGVKMGLTPCKIELKRNSEYTIEFKKDGYNIKSYRVTNSVGAGWIVLDILGGLIPVIIDASTGAWYSLDQDNINVMLEKQ